MTTKTTAALIVDLVCDTDALMNRAAGAQNELPLFSEARAAMGAALYHLDQAMERLNAATEAAKAGR